MTRQSTAHFANLLETTKKLITKHLWAKVLLGLLFGGIFGFVLNFYIDIDPQVKLSISEWVSLPGRLFLVLIQMMLIPIIVTSIVLGIYGSESLEKLKKIAVKILPYFALTTLVSTIVGFVCVYLINPGESLKGTRSIEVKQVIETGSETINVPERLIQLLPHNPLGAFMEGQLLQIVLFSFLIGVALVSLPKEQANPLYTLLLSVQRLAMVVVGWAMMLAPYAVFGLTMKLTATVGIEVFKGLGLYSLTVVAALFIILIIYSVVVLVVSGVSPVKFFKKISDLQLLAFSTSSSASIMPMSMDVVENRFSVRQEVSRFVIPLGATINMDGTAAYQAIATVFVAQIYGLDLGLSQLFLVSLTATAASIGAPGTPGVGIAVLAGILTTLGLPNEAVLLIVGVDRILDMLRTVVNVTGDVTASILFNKIT